MKLWNTLLAVATVIVIAWLLGTVLKLAAWLLSGLIGVAAIIVIIGIIRATLLRSSTRAPSKKSTTSKEVIDI